MSKSYKGSCLCQAVKYEIRGDLTGISFCHCSLCRKVSGAASGAMAIASPDHLVWQQGEDKIRKYHFGSSWTSTFCSDCGSPLPQCHAEAAMCFVPAGTLDDDPGPAKMAHIYLGSKASWDTVADDAPHFDESYT